MNYRSLSDFNRAIQRWSEQLPPDVVLVVGVPRSGLLAALLLALYRNLPVADLDRFLEGRVLGAGDRLGGESRELAFPEHGTILVVDDSVASGNEIRRVKAKVAAAGVTLPVRYGAVYVTDESKMLVDCWHEVVKLPRVFEWNIMSHAILSHACVDIDGVLCRDPSEQENDDGPGYRHFLANVAPLIVPRVEMGWLVTCRLEKYRAVTEKWLQDNGFRYRQLIMMDLPDKASRQAARGHASFKATHYRNTRASLFVESSSGQASEIARLSGKQVYCIASRQMVQPSALTNGIRQPKRLIKAVLRQSTIGRHLLHAYRRAIGKA